MITLNEFVERFNRWLLVADNIGSVTLSNKDLGDLAEVIDYLVVEANKEIVRHGEWKSLPFGMRICSECNYLIGRKKRFSKPNYCPNCGAKMDRGKEE